MHQCPSSEAAVERATGASHRCSKDLQGSRGCFSGDTGLAPHPSERCLQTSGEVLPGDRVEMTRAYGSFLVRWGPRKGRGEHVKHRDTKSMHLGSRGAQRNTDLESKTHTCRDQGKQPEERALEAALTHAVPLPRSSG